MYISVCLCEIACLSCGVNISASWKARLYECSWHATLLKWYTKNVTNTTLQNVHATSRHRMWFRTVHIKFDSIWHEPCVWCIDTFGAQSDTYQEVTKHTPTHGYAGTMHRPLYIARCKQYESYTRFRKLTYAHYKHTASKAGSILALMRCSRRLSSSEAIQTLPGSHVHVAWCTLCRYM